MSDRAGEGPTDREWINEANKRLEKKGVKSRYVDSKPTQDWTTFSPPLETISAGERKALDPEYQRTHTPPENVRRQAEEHEWKLLRRMADKMGPLQKAQFIEASGIRNGDSPELLARKLDVEKEKAVIRWRKSAGLDTVEEETELARLEAKLNESRVADPYEAGSDGDDHVSGHGEGETDSDSHSEGDADSGSSECDSDDER